MPATRAKGLLMANLHQESARPTVRRRELAERLRRLRGGAELTEDQVAGRLDWSVSKLSRFEHAHEVRQLPSPRVHSERMASIRRRDATRRIRRFRRGCLSGPPRRPGTTADRRLCARSPQGRSAPTEGGTCHLRGKKRSSSYLATPLTSTNGLLSCRAASREPRR